jgi:tRNA (Thr-GGU) A37 N-methylase
VPWWANRHDSPQSREILRCEFPYAPGVEAGVFTCRAECRPNPIAVTVCPILELDEEAGRIAVADIDAFADSSILDLKPYHGVIDRVRDVTCRPGSRVGPSGSPRRG